MGDSESPTVEQLLFSREQFKVLWTHKTKEGDFMRACTDRTRGKDLS